MKGIVRPVSLARRLMIDLMHASVPLVVVKTTLKLDRLVKARSALAVRPGWTPIFAKAICIVGGDEPSLRTFYLKWPWPHFYEVPRSLVMAVVIRDSFDSDVPVMLKLGVANEQSLMELDSRLKLGKSGPLDAVPSIERQLRINRLPFPLRRLMWAIALNIGRQRANHFGTVSITSLANLGVETVSAQAPGPILISYGKLAADNSMEVLLHWDHHIFDGIVAARAMRRMEEVMNGEIADELLAGA
jgi:hypothetical protein